MSETYNKLLEHIELPPTFVELYLLSNAEQELIVYGRASAPNQHIRMVFDRVHAFMAHEEFSHPSIGSPHQSTPPLSKGSEYYYPVLEVQDSQWRATFPDYRVSFESNVQHVQILSLSNTIDLIFSGRINASYVAEAQFLEIEKTCK